MFQKRSFQFFAAIVMLWSLVAVPGSASAASTSVASGCPSQIIVQSGDTLSSIAYACGTTTEAILAANPGISSTVTAGQVLNIPAASTTTYVYTTTVYSPVYATYIVQWGDTLGTIAARFGCSAYDIMAVNPQIWNPNLIYAGQIINLPATATVVPAPVYYAPTPVVVYSPTSGSVQYAYFTVDYKDGLYVRSGPGKEYKIINSALNDTKWQYNIYSRTFDTKGQLWVQVNIIPIQNGYSQGWVLVKDPYTHYFTDPHID